jgi:hypothetical protein
LSEVDEFEGASQSKHYWKIAQLIMGLSDTEIESRDVFHAVFFRSYDPIDFDSFVFWVSLESKPQRLSRNFMPKSLNNFSLIALSFENCRLNRNLDSRHETAGNGAALSANRLIMNTKLPSRYHRLIYLFVYFSCRNRNGSELDEAKVDGFLSETKRKFVCGFDGFRGHGELDNES